MSSGTKGAVSYRSLCILPIDSLEVRMLLDLSDGDKRSSLFEHAAITTKKCHRRKIDAHRDVNVLDGKSRRSFALPGGKVPPAMRCAMQVLSVGHRIRA